MTLTPARLKELEEVAENAIRLRRQGHPDPLERRFDVAPAVALMIRGRVSAAPNLRHEGRRVSGLFMPGGAFPQIWFEAYEPPRRQRFTVAHELGHSYLDPARQPQCDPSQVDVDPDSSHGGQDVRESDADAFAAAFLIPADLLRADVKQFGRCAAFLADLYDVSEPTMRRRLRVLEPFV